jgi:basic amino acid/polyamine antiporter, APA family
VASSILSSVIIALNYTRGLVQAFTFLILIATLTTLLPYVFSSLTAVRLALRDRRTGWARATGRLVVAVMAFLYSVFAISGAGRDAIYWGFLLMLGGLPVYVAMRWHLPGHADDAGPAGPTG